MQDNIQIKSISLYNFEQKIFWALAVLIGLTFAFYVYIIQSTIVHIVERKTAETQIRDTESEIADLKVQLEKLNFTVVELNATIVDLTSQNDQKAQTIDQQTVELNTAYYVIGLRKDLKTKGVIVGDKVSQKVNPESYNKVDIRYFTELSLNVKRAKLLSTHPEGSYEMVMKGKIIEKLVVKNAKSFWSISKFLVIETD